MPMRKTLQDRFWSKVNKGLDSECWEWTGNCAKGYGKIGIGGKHGATLPTHRVSWEIHHGLIPEGLWVLHKCDNPKCVNPNHLFLGTASDNAKDMAAKNRNKNGTTKLTVENVVQIRSMNQLPHGKIAAIFSVSRPTISRILSEKTWGACTADGI